MFFTLLYLHFTQVKDLSFCSSSGKHYDKGMQTILANSHSVHVFFFA